MHVSLCNDLYYKGVSKHFTDTVEPLHKGHIGDNINLVVLYFVERSIITLCPYFGGSTLVCFTVLIIAIGPSREESCQGPVSLSKCLQTD